MQDSFTKEIIEIWSNLTHYMKKTQHSSATRQFGTAPSVIRIANRPIFYSDWAHAGVNQAKDLLDLKFDFLKYEDFKTRYKINATF